MKKYIDFCADGVLKARYDSAINKTIPASAVEVSDALFRQTIAETDGIWMIDRSTGDIAKHPFPPPTPDELRSQFDAAVTQRLEDFAKTPYSETEQPFDNMDRARLSSLSGDYKMWGDRANALYDMTWRAAEVILPQVISGALTIEAAMAQLPALSWSA